MVSCFPKGGKTDGFHPGKQNSLREIPFCGCFGRHPGVLYPRASLTTPRRKKWKVKRNPESEGEFVMFLKTPAEINRNYKSFKRFLCIIETAAAYGFRELAESLDTKKRFHFYEKPELIGCSRPRKLRMLLEELGPTFVKFGQILSTRTDLLPPDYTAELAKLTENVTPFPQEEAVRILTEELGTPPEELFREFDRVSIAAASILAKTHRDRWMTQAASDYPGYGFEIHKGYGTALHLEALKQHGVTPLHRRTFAPVREILFPPEFTQQELF